MATLRLPLYVLCLIVNEVADISRASLPACALLTPAVVPLVQYHIFSNIFLDSNQRCHRLFSCLERNPKFRPYIKAVVVHNLGDGQDRYDGTITNHSDLAGILAHLPNIALLEVKFFSSANINFSELSVALQTALLACFRTIVSFSSRALSNIPLNQFSSARLKRLRVFHIPAAWHEPTNVGCVAPSPHTITNLDNVEVNCSQCFKMIVAPSLNHYRLKKLTIYSATSDFLQDALSGTHITLEDLTIGPMETYDVTYTPTSLPKLHVLRYHGTAHSLQTFLRLSASILQHEIAPLSLRRFHIIIELYSIDIESVFSPSDTWKALDGVLADPKFLELNDVCVTILRKGRTRKKQDDLLRKEALRQRISERMQRCERKLLVEFDDKYW